MDINQISNLVQYYDEERRKDRVLLVQMQERVESLLRENEARSRYAQGLETSITELKSRVARADGWQTAIETARAEFKQNVARAEESFKRVDTDAQRVRQVELESVTRQIAELKREIKPYARYADDFEGRKQEDARLSELIGKLQVQAIDLDRRLDQPGAAISYLEEQRRQDAKRIVQVEDQLPDLRRKIDALPPQLLLLDEGIRKKQLEIEEAGKMLEAQSQLMENQRVSDIRRERQFAEYVSVVEQLKVRADDISTQTTGFIQMREDVRRVLNEFPEFERRMEARINELFEIQRDAEERTKRQTESFKDRIDKDWLDFATSQNEKWFDRDRRISEYDGRFDEVEDELAKIPSLHPLYGLIELMAKQQAAAGREAFAALSARLDEARTTSTSDVRLSRRQKRKRSTLKAEEIGSPIPVTNGVHQDDDLLS